MGIPTLSTILCCSLEKGKVELKRLINQSNYEPHNTEDLNLK
jgi:hypothetical protein